MSIEMATRGAGSNRGDWYRCDIDRKTLKRLSRRTNKDGVIQFGGFFAILLALGIALVYAWNTWLAIPIFAAYSLVWSFGNATGHEACHGTPFRSHRLNQLLLYVSSWMENWEPVTVRWVHARHHSHTSFVGDDAEYLVPNAIKWKGLVGLLTGWNQVWYYNKELVQLSCGHANPFIRVSVPESELPKVHRNARLYLASYIGVVAFSVHLGSWLPVCLLILPRMAGAPMHGILRITQHGALQTGVADHRKTTRTMHVNPVLQFFYCNMNYHIEHHMFPMVPFHSLEALHEQIKDQTPKPSKGVTGAMREVVETMRAQRINPELAWNPNIGSVS